MVNTVDDDSWRKLYKVVTKKLLRSLIMVTIESQTVCDIAVVLFQQGDEDGESVGRSLQELLQGAVPR